ncbi:methyl-accepting chemotaxis protein [Argonema antarcticum]|uniref:methyl-accepting chemotaxis protein n=1 Tax=Argonema antarcticum TaxID=2942763 RepID=UPI0020128E6B|nr:methyl-accepting chemotaxis protein [Argonema antarcticum]MCL1473771.1 methyl-accepting chemotaxis protein [Argonema antarcticum A004/B2]
MLNKITNRILLGYSTPLIFMIGVGFIVYLTTQRFSESQRAIQEQYKMIRVEEELTYGVSRMTRNVRGYAVFFDDRETRDSYKKSYNSGYESFREKAEELKRIVPNYTQDKAIGVLISEGENYHQKSQEIFRLFDEKKVAEGTEMLKSIRFAEYDEARNDFLDRSDYLLNQKTKALEQAQQLLLVTLAVSILLSIIGTIVTAVAITLPLKQQLPIAIGATEQIARGDLTQNIEVADDGSEIGQLLKAFQIMTQKLNSLIRHVQESGIQVSGSVTSIVASSKELEATVTEQYSTTNKVAVTAKQIAAASSQLVKTINQVEYKSQTTASAAVESQKDLMQMETSMVKLADATNTISEKLGAIGEKAKNINDIIITIVKVADQTNLLSLNAAIEAEKAGEYGKGFSVVAREISRLADLTAVATLDIENTIEDMQGAVSIGVREMDNFTQQVKEIVEVVSSISPKLESIIREVQSLTPQFKQVSNSMEAQSEEASQISDSMLQLSEGSSQIVEVLRDINGAMGKLDDASQNLHLEISRFKVAQI